MQQIPPREAHKETVVKKNFYEEETSVRTTGWVVICSCTLKITNLLPKSTKDKVLQQALDSIRQQKVIHKLMQRIPAGPEDLNPMELVFLITEQDVETKESCKHTLVGTSATELGGTF